MSDQDSQPLPEITEATEVSDQLVEGLQRLIPQLSETASLPSKQELETIIGCDNSRLLVAQLGQTVIASLTLVINQLPSGIKARIEDLVVDKHHQQLGLGRALTETAIDMAEAAGAAAVDLTSRPSREVANYLYTSVGFELRATNFYRYTIYP